MTCAGTAASSRHLGRYARMRTRQGTSVSACSSCQSERTVVLLSMKTHFKSSSRLRCSCGSGAKNEISAVPITASTQPATCHSPQIVNYSESTRLQRRAYHSRLVCESVYQQLVCMHACARVLCKRMHMRVCASYEVCACVHVSVPMLLETCHAWPSVCW
jgi:hypothetical protein